MGGRGGGFRSSGGGGGGSLSDMKSAYSSLLREQADLGMSLNMGSAEENAARRAKWQENRSKLNDMQRKIREEQAKQDDAYRKAHPHTTTQHKVPEYKGGSARERAQGIKFIKEALRRAGMK